MYYTTLSSQFHPVYLHPILDNGIENHNLENKLEYFILKMYLSQGPNNSQLPWHI